MSMSKTAAKKLAAALTNDENRVLGALGAQDGGCFVHELLDRYDFTNPSHFGGDKHDFRQRASALLNVDLGINGLRDRDLVGYRWSTSGAKTLHLTPEGVALLAAVA